jgi:hypothetical protein
MKTMQGMIRQHSARLTAIALIIVFYGLARQPDITIAERNNLASRFHFAETELPVVLTQEKKRDIRQVHPSLQRIAAWVSATGAGVALNDLDGDGLPNDLCVTDPRDDSVTVMPAPGMSQRYQPFALNAGPLYDRATMAPMGCIPADYNEDGFMDLLQVYWGRTPLLFLARSPASGKTFIPSEDAYLVQEVIPSGERWFTGAATVADLDGDGHLDIAIGNYYQDGAHILNTHADVSHVRQQMQHSMTRAFNGGRSRLLRWVSATTGDLPSVRYREVKDFIAPGRSAKEVEELTHGWTLALAAADINGDLLPELYFANDFGPDRLLLNRSAPGQFRFVPLEGEKTLTTPSSKVLGRDGYKGMGVDVGDINGDGKFDLFVSNIAAPYALQESHFLFLNTGDLSRLDEGVAPFIDASEALGVSRSSWSWDAKMGDFDNDGNLEIVQANGFVKGEVNRWPELHELAMGNDQLLSDPRVWPEFQAGDALSDQHPNPFFVRASDGRFYDIAHEVRLDRKRISRGIATADVNGDGRLDFAYGNMWSNSTFFINESPAQNAFLGLHLRLPVGDQQAKPTRVFAGHPTRDTLSRPATGAFVSVGTPEGRSMVAQVDGGNGHSGKRSNDLHFGLGTLPAGARLRVEVHWRDRNGSVHAQTLQLTPGWHTVILGQ